MTTKRELYGQIATLERQLAEQRDHSLYMRDLQASERKAVNVNTKVRFKLTVRGEALYRANVDKYDHQPNVRQWLLAKLTEPVMEMPLWEFANIFGPGLHMGTEAVTELNTIEIDAREKEGR